MILSPCATQKEPVSSNSGFISAQNDDASITEQASLSQEVASPTDVLENTASAQNEPNLPDSADLTTTQNDDASIIIEESSVSQNDASPTHVLEDSAFEDFAPTIAVLEEQFGTLRVSLDINKLNPNPPQCASSHSDMEPMDVPNVDVSDCDPDVHVAIPIIAPIDVNTLPLKNRPSWIKKVRAKMPKPMPKIKEEADESSDNNKENRNTDSAPDLF